MGCLNARKDRGEAIVSTLDIDLKTINAYSGVAECSE